MIATAPVNSPLVSVLGGGQLGRMLALAGLPLGIEFRFLDPSPVAGAGTLAPLVVGDLGDVDRIDELAQGATVVTYEWEGVPADGARAAARHAPVRPDPRALDVAQDRLVEKETFQRLGIGVAPFVAVDERAELERAVDAVGMPAILKTRRGGYDGKGQHAIDTATDIDAAWEALGGVPLILEGRIPFTRELSVLAVRCLDGDTRCYPLVQNEHADGILRVSTAPAPDLTPELQAEGEAIATRLLDELEYVGVLAVELFEHEGRLLANELAPRVHNSGHWTIEGAETSQFENHLRAILGMPLGSTETRGYSAMVNCIGTMPDADAVASVEGAYLHDYLKAPRSGRKLGHVTVVADTPDARDERLHAVKEVVDLHLR
ncbi:MAG: 5-(carboxyamino)imidazole ribonucleotide synthase [Acidimicrobiia bacterium]|nr:5-(carboxyamino)imidazole ribonucleotide synthase [Acidimicrobiia bacterium]